MNGQDLLDALVKVHLGDDPSVVYLELIANSRGHDLPGVDDIEG